MIMELPIPPTDNLYKFLSIAGLFVIVVSLSIPVYFILGMRQKLTEFRTEAAVLSVELKYLKQDAEQVSTEKDKRGRSAMEDNPERRAKLKELEIREARLNQAVTEADWTSRMMHILMAFIGVGSVAGGILTGKGFALWYYRLQRYQDEIVKTQAAK